ncbi:MAG TPA: rhodanese-like domain-containing protein [Verrucomicrobiota bacterium]|nr:sulfurtransferase [Verrucomicrobiales bacterium]HRI16011.1 rhodanese-like domain-containing protein [Verrucomicrobiota bacterium]
MRTVCCLLLGITLTSALPAAEGIKNPAIDFPQFLRLAAEVAPVRERHRVSEAEFIAMAGRPDTVVLDARSADKFVLRHIKGAINLPFTDFTEATLARVIPSKASRVLIYCNNNFVGAQASFASKAAPASLNISTFVALATYGYRNVYELGPLLDVAATKLPFTGTEVTK